MALCDAMGSTETEVVWRAGPIKRHWSGQGGIKHKIKWSHSRQPRWLPVSLGTSVQERNYLSYARHI